MSLLPSFPRRLSFILMASLPVTASFAQTPTWNSPANGYVYDSAAQQVRPIIGFVGSAVLGSSTVGQADWGSIAPNQKSALVEQSGSLVWIRDLAAPGITDTVNQDSLPRQASWASDSTRAVLLTRDNSLEWLSFRGSVPAPESSWKLNQFSRLAARGTRPSWYLLAADSSADQVLLTTHTGRSWQVWLASRKGPPTLLSFSGQPLAAAFSSQGSAAYLADAASHQIVRITGLNQSPSVTPLISSELYIQNPAGLALSADERRLALLDRNLRLVRVFDAVSGSLLSEIPVDDAPDSITPMSSSRFLLNPAAGSASRALYLLDTGLPASISFVPRGE